MSYFNYLNLKCQDNVKYLINWERLLYTVYIKNKPTFE